jgi:hypothetical protein
MKKTGNSLFLLGKAAYYIGMLLLFNFFFGLIFLRFFLWLIVGGILLVGLIGALLIGKNMLFGIKNTSANRTKDRYNAQSTDKDIIDVEAQVFDANNQE